MIGCSSLSLTLTVCVKRKGGFPAPFSDKGLEETTNGTESGHVHDPLPFQRARGECRAEVQKLFSRGERGRKEEEEIDRCVGFPPARKTRNYESGADLWTCFAGGASCALRVKEKRERETRKYSPHLRVRDGIGFGNVIVF